MDELGDKMTNYGLDRLAKGLPVAFGSSGEDLRVHIDESGDVILSGDYSTFRIPCKLRRNISDALLAKATDAGSECWDCPVDALPCKRETCAEEGCIMLERPNE